MFYGFPYILGSLFTNNFNKIQIKNIFRLEFEPKVYYIYSEKCMTKTYDY